jgi:hypothetical protein
MKKITFIIIMALFFFSTTYSQKKERIKGSKVVTTALKEVDPFNALEIDDNFEVFLEKGDKNEVKIEADDNLHPVILMDLRAGLLRIYTSKEITGYKKLILKIIYTSDLKAVTSKNEAIINAIDEINLENITFSAFDYSKLYLNVRSKEFTLKSDDKSKVELNLKSESSKIELSKSATVKALVSSVNLTCDLYQKAAITLEGDAMNAVIRLDNNSEFIGSKFNIKNADLTAEGYTSCSLYAETTAIIAATDKSEIYLLGTPKIDLKKFVGEAKLIKKIK